MKQDYSSILRSLLLSLVGVLTLTQCYAPRDEYEVGVPVKVRLAISVPESPVKNMRAAAAPDDENRIYNLAVFYFEGGNLNARPRGEFFEGTGFPAVLNKEVSLEVATGAAKFVVIANLATDTHKTITGLKKSDFFDATGKSTINSLDDLKNKVVSYNANEETIFADGAATSFLMVSKPETEYTIRNDGQPLQINVERLASKIEFTLNEACLDKFTPTGWRVVNVPRKAYLIERPFTTSNNHDASGANTAADYFKSHKDDTPEGIEDWHPWESSGHGNEFSFYSFENRKTPNREISTTTTPDKTDRYRLRAKRDKQNIYGAASDAADQKNGDFKYAPKYCTYVQIRGTFRGKSATSINGNTQEDVYAQVVYTIPLGYDKEDANDYKVERNVYYRYKVNVTGVKDVIVEASRNAPNYDDAERHPGTEGIVTQGKPKWDWELDSHYEQRLLSFGRDKAYMDLDINKTYIVITTPFGVISSTYEELIKDQALLEKAKKLTSWIQVRRNNMDGSQGWLYYYGGTQTELCRYPSQKENGAPLYNTMYWGTNIKEENLLMDMFKWLNVLIEDKKRYPAQEPPYTKDYYGNNDPTTTPFTIFGFKDSSPAKKDWCYATVYFDEYYYEKHPLTDQPVKWNTFVGKGPRSLFVFKQRKVSKDGNSIYLTDPLIRVVQHPIHTFYDANSVDVPVRNFLPEDWSETNKTSLQGYGVESITESSIGQQFLNYPYIAHDYAYANALAYTAPNYNGWANWTQLAKLRELNNHGGGWNNDKWSKYYRGNEPDLLAENADTYKGSTRYECLNKNRDLNRNGKIDPEEIRWYLPSINQLMELGLAEDAFPENVRLYNSSVQGSGKTRQNMSYVSSTIRRMGPSNGNSFTVAYLWSSQVFATNADPNREANGDAMKGYSHRCVRRLGGPSEYSPSKGVLAYDLSSKYNWEQQENTNYFHLYMGLSGMNPHLIRLPKYFVSKGEQQDHKLQSPEDKPYKQFYVSRSIVPWTGDNTCANYTEGKFSTPGDWRIPNMREMGYIISTFDIGENDDNFKWVWGTGAEVKLQNNMVFVVRTSVAGDGNRMHMRYNTGYQWHVQSSQVGLEGHHKYVRCVKDKL